MLINKTPQPRFLYNRETAAAPSLIDSFVGCVCSRAAAGAIIEFSDELHKVRAGAGSQLRNCLVLPNV